MLTVQIEITGPRATTEREAVIDTGLPGGLWLPKSVARKLGAILLPPEHPVRAVDGRVIPGFATVLTVRVPEADVEVETYVFCPNARTRETLLGSFFLSQVRAVLILGNTELPFPRVRLQQPNPPRGRLDIGEWVIPIRPVTPWW